MELNLRLGVYHVFIALCGLSMVYAEYCIEYGHSCIDPHECCGKTCCIRPDMEEHYRYHLRRSVWNMWYFWFVVLFILMSCFGGCSYYRRHQLLIARQQNLSSGGMDETYPSWRFSPTFPISLFAGYSNRARQQRISRPENMQHTTMPLYQPATTVPLYQPATSPIFPLPPPYSEVMSQPDVYPAQKDQELPPYPGLPPYSSQFVQLPPYSPPIVSTATTDNSYQVGSGSVESSNIISDGNTAASSEPIRQAPSDSPPQGALDRNTS